MDRTGPQRRQTCQACCHLLDDEIGGLPEECGEGGSRLKNKDKRREERAAFGPLPEVDYRFRLTNSPIISSAVVTTRAFAWNPRWAPMRLINSSPRSTFDSSREFDS